MSLFVETLEGVKFDLEKLGIRLIKFDVESPSPRHHFETVDGKDGSFDLGSTYGPRNIRVSFKLNAIDMYDYMLAVDEVFHIFNGKSPFYVINIYEPKKRWKVKVTDPYTPDWKSPQHSIFEINLVSAFPYAESYGTTLDPFTFTSEKWQVGQGVISEDLVYAHNTTTFRIYNGSDIDIDPREIPLKIKYQGSSTNLKIKNVTTGDEWAYTGTSGVNDTIKLDGIRSLKNNLTIFGQTNRKLITLAKGWNDFTLTGASGSFLISFDFRFYNI